MDWNKKGITTERDSLVTGPGGIRGGGSRILKKRKGILGSRGFLSNWGPEKRQSKKEMRTQAQR